MATLVDTNLLLRIAQPNAPEYPAAAHSIATLFRRGETMPVFPQVFHEFWSVATRPAGPPGNGLGLAVGAALAELRQFEGFFPLLPDTPAVYQAWRDLIEQWGITGRQAHDARLIAAMIAHGVPNILTFDVGHFRRYEQRGIVIAGQPLSVLHPGDV